MSREADVFSFGERMHATACCTTHAAPRALSANLSTCCPGLALTDPTPPQPIRCRCLSTDPAPTSHPTHTTWACSCTCPHSSPPLLHPTSIPAGVLLWEMFSGRPIWRDPDVLQSGGRGLPDPRTFAYALPPVGCPPGFESLVKACLAEQPKVGGQGRLVWGW